MKYTAFHEQRFRDSVTKALKTVEKILTHSRDPRLAEDEEHRYDDKFALAELLTNTAIACQINCFEKLGLDGNGLLQVLEWAKENRTVTLRFQAEDDCTFLKEQVIGGSSKERKETEESAGKKDSKARLTPTIQEYHWKIGIKHRIALFSDNDVEHAVELQSRSSSTNITTLGDASDKRVPPISEKTVHRPFDIPVTWFFRMISSDSDKFHCQFTIDRFSNKGKKSCKTPRRNSQVKAAVDSFQAVYHWSHHVQTFLKSRVEMEILAKGRRSNKSKKTAPKDNGSVEDPTLDSVTAEDIFCPLIPLFGGDGRLGNDDKLRRPHLNSLVALQPNTKDEGSLLLPVSDVNLLLNEQVNTIDGAIETMRKTFPPRQLVKLVSIAEATIILVSQHMQQIATQWEDCLDYLEDLLKQQFVAAIGKEVQPKDFAKFIQFNNQRLFRAEYAPKQFVYAIRRSSDHAPDGSICIETVPLLETVSEPIETTVRHIRCKTDMGEEGAPSMFIPILAGTSVEINGDRYIHGWIQHRFMKKHKENFQLTVSARQFSCFILMIGTVSGPRKFEPRHALLLENKDEITIPLQSAMLPSAKHFEEAVSSLSPEHAEFCRAFRATQLEPSVCALCVVQLKPQLEKLLKLPIDALSQEIKLTHDLLSLFSSHQIPPDFLRYNGPAGAPAEEKISAVKRNVTAIMEMIEQEKQDVCKEASERPDLQRVGDLQTDHSEASAGMDMSYNLHGGGHTSTASFADFQAEADNKLLEKLQLAVRRSTLVPQAPQSPVPGGKVRRATIAGNSQHNVSNHNSGHNSVVSGKGASQRRTSVVSKQQLIGISEIQDSGSGVGDDFTLLPRIVESRLEKTEKTVSVRATVVKAGSPWQRKRQATVLSKPTFSIMTVSEVASERRSAFDLLYAISRGGALPIDCAELHVLVAVTHCFDNDVVGTVIQDNVNCIEKTEESAVIVASAIHGEARLQDLIQDSADLARLGNSFPALLHSGGNSGPLPAAIEDAGAEQPGAKNTKR